MRDACDVEQTFLGWRSGPGCAWERVFGHPGWWFYGVELLAVLVAAIAIFVVVVTTVRIVRASPLEPRRR